MLKSFASPPPPTTQEKTQCGCKQQYMLKYTASPPPPTNPEKAQCGCCGGAIVTARAVAQPFPARNLWCVQATKPFCLSELPGAVAV